LPVWRMAASLSVLAALSVLIWQISGLASVRATFNVPLLSSQPCVAMMLALPLPGAVAAFSRWMHRLHHCG
jgi:hypothetical protein